ncbi:UNVERIFIED_CONTAM: hypothetical protein LK11_02150 [Mumia flava]
MGLPKTGTTYLQNVLWRSRRQLGEQDLSILPDSHSGAYAVMLAARRRLDPALDVVTSEKVLDDLRQRAATAPTRDVLLSQEQLAACTPDQIGDVRRCFDGFELHIVVTARSLARQIPSAWQERIKSRQTYGYPEFVDAVVAKEPLARSFWRHQGLQAVARRWGAASGPERVHLVVLPSASTDPRRLLAQFCSVVGVSPETLDTSVDRGNPSLGYVQAELLRRVNVALGQRLAQPRAGYAQVAKPYMAHLLRDQSSPPPLLPRRVEGWCRETSERWITWISERGYDVVGDLADLRPSSSSFSDDPLAGLDAQVEEAAVRALASALAQRVDEQRESGEYAARLPAHRRRDV